MVAARATTGVGIRQLFRIYHSMAYFGPGLVRGPNGEPA